jgi:tRNA nucleotidyltransferase (CCA-adding enzyme)
MPYQSYINKIVTKLLEDQEDNIHKNLAQHLPLLKTVQDLVGSGRKTAIVGGAVRDAAMGEKPKDIDMVTTATPEELTSRGFTPVGKGFPVFLHPQIKDSAGNPVELAVSRGERKTGKGHTGVSTVYEPKLEKDLLRRDFTINAMAYDGSILDPYEGLQDLKSKRLKHVSQAFAEDPLRILRGARFSSKYDFDVDPQTIKLMQDIAPELSTEPVDRVKTEFLRSLNSKHPGNFFKVLNQANSLSPWFSEMEQMLGIPAGDPISHPEGDVFTHSLNAANFAARKGFNQKTRLLALLHDVGKISTPKDQLPKHKGHEDRVQLASDFLTRLNFDSKTKKETSGHINYHLHPAYNSRNPLKAGTWLKYWKTIKPFQQEHLDAVLSDMNGKGKPEIEDPSTLKKPREVFTALNNTKIIPGSNKEQAIEQFIRSIKAVK